MICPVPTLSYSKGSRGLFVPSRVIGIFTDTTISLGSWLRQCPDHYTIRAGRNLPDKEFRYLRTVIVTAAAVFLLNSCLDLFSAPHSREDPFSRSYRVNLPSSLTMNLPSALVYSTRPRVSVYGTGIQELELSGFSRESDYLHFQAHPKAASTLMLQLCGWICLPASASLHFNALFRQGAEVSLLRLRIASLDSNGIFTVSAIALSRSDYA